MLSGHFKVLFTIFVGILSLSSLVCGETKCMYFNPDTQLWYNLAPMTVPAGEDDYSFTDVQGNVYFINVCEQASQGGCSPANGVCQVSLDEVPHGCGSGHNPTFYPYFYDRRTDGLTMVYLGGEYCKAVKKGRSSYLNFICDPKLAGPGFIAHAQADPQYSGCVYAIDFQSQYACGRLTEQEALNFVGIPLVTEPEGGIDIGWFIILGICVFFFVYIVIGMLIKFKKYEARGLDLVPNIGFWSDIPYLIKDGFCFVGNKISSGRFCAEHEYGYPGNNYYHD